MKKILIMLSLVTALILVITYYITWFLIAAFESIAVTN